MNLSRPFLLAAALVLATGGLGFASVRGEVRGLLVQRFDVHCDDACSGRRLVYDRLEAYYRGRQHEPVWVGDRGVLPAAAALVAAVQAADRHGLDPRDYHRDALAARLGATGAGDLADLEVLLTDAYLRYSAELRGGRASARPADPSWAEEASRVDHFAALAPAVAAGTLATLLEELAPPNPRYRALQAALAHHRAVAAAGGWPPLPPGEVLKPGMTHPQVELLRARLRGSGDLAPGGPRGPFYDPLLEAAVGSFQGRHGLAVDGVVGARTREALNVPVADRIRQLVWNLERWRWMPREFERRLVLVNMAGFGVELLEDGATVLTMKAIVGRGYRQTPMFRDRMTYLVFNPYWTIPPKLAVEDILPKVRKDPGYLGQEGIRVFSGWGREATELPPETIDWSRLGKGRFPFKLRQDPGPRNSLGRVKFMFPNRYNVYLHDTPNRELFRRPVRTFSSGCIRVEKPLELALRLLEGQAGWDGERVQAALDGKEPQVVWLQRPAAVYLVYWTAWVDGTGITHFRDDVYGRDQDLAKSLAQGRFPPGDGG